MSTVSLRVIRGSIHAKIIDTHEILNVKFQTDQIDGVSSEIVCTFVGSVVS